jgi:hypothetical protein
MKASQNKEEAIPGRKRIIGEGKPMPRGGKKMEKRRLPCLASTTALFALLIFTAPAFSGSLEPPGPPTEGEGTMHTLEEIYNKVDRLDGLLDAIAKTPDEVCGGQFFIGLRPEGTLGEMVGTGGGDSCCEAGQRFGDNGDGTVLDCQTGLIWLKDANCLGMMNWSNAMNAAAALNDGECGLTDGNAAGTGQWSEGDVFNGVVSNFYWSRTSISPDLAHVVDVGDGWPAVYNKSFPWWVWPVR